MKRKLYSVPMARKRRSEVKKGTFPDCNAEMLKGVRGSSGYGTLTGVTERFVMSGHWKNGMLDGFGSHLDSDGSWYEGGWKTGQANGYGRKVFQDGSTYFGEWVGGNFHGFGRREWSSGSYHEGEWHANMKHGEGEFVEEDQDVAEITVSRALLKRYKENLAAYRAKLYEFCTRRGISCLFTSTQVPFETLVLTYLRQRGLVR